MFFDEDDERFIRMGNPDLFHVVRRELFAASYISSSLDVTPYGLRSVPTHTEDGIPIRKLYVSNLPPKTTRNELFGVFAQYGFIKSCWLRMGEKGPNKSPVPTYAFVTFSNPSDAHKALLAPNNEKMLRGRNLRISPADSWHQPAEDADGRVRWKPRGDRNDEVPQGSAAAAVADPTNAPETSADTAEASSSEVCDQPQTDKQEEASDEEPCYTILDVLNQDCLTHILSYVPIRDLIRSERVSKDWQNMIQEYLLGIRMFKTSWWQHVPVTLTTAVLRRVLQRLGHALLRLHIDHHWSALNDRTAHTVGKFCPNLEELIVVGMHTKNWNPLIYGCKQLKNISFISCNKLTDSSLIHLVKNESNIESLTVANNTHVTGLFLTGSNPSKLHSLSFYNCYSLQGTVLSASLDNLTNITTLKLDLCPVTLWKIIPLILSKLPKLEELSLSEYTSVEQSIANKGTEALCEALAKLTELRRLDLNRNIYITNAVLKQVAQSCTKLEALDVSCCNAKKTFPFTGVGDDGVVAVCVGCPSLARVDVSYLSALSDNGVAGLARCASLAALTARGNPHITTGPLAACLHACHHLQTLDLCGCDNITEELVEAAAKAVAARPRPVPLLLQVGGTGITPAMDLPKHKLLRVDTMDDRCSPHLRPDFMDRVFDGSSDDSMDDLYQHDDLEDFLGPGNLSEDDLFLDDDDDDLDDYEGLYAYGLHGADIILL